ncbi:TadG family pilus assembly protein [Profundibacterium mesophilum]|uniref:Flp pilus-assembly TadE/G-likedomain containing protein n=1 Tax=Profundibacterium mesophilum KAUST100406-0324 TaxID=1037889 RepID=A0A921NQW2_9RHOB|nr:TadG family pilus assembly protein [Profundibacterium mesophilum]KAF0675707.1 putative Flp pilus-assembly TadE/G-likedomain containing protein [Profundibacterium mesophilum KAUST100406-0324]
MFLTSAALSALALDTAQLYAARVQLQVAADVAAHAALYSRDSIDEQSAKDRALLLARNALPKGRYGDVLLAEEIEFGTWDAETWTFTPKSGARSAVHVGTGRLAQKANPASVFLLQFLGITQLDVRAVSVFEAYIPKCLTEGLVADGIVDMQSNNYVHKGFCIHSNTHVELNNNNTFEPGSVVSMPDKADVVTPHMDDSSNPGMIDALHSYEYRLRVLSRIEALIAGVADPSSRYMPSYIKNTNVVSIKGKNVRTSDLRKGRIHRIECAGNNVSIDAGTVIEEMVLITDCPVSFNGEVTMINSIFGNTSLSKRSFNGSSTVVMGRRDNCSPGGGASIVTRGGMAFAAKIELHGSQFLAGGDVSFSAQGQVIEGASIIAGGQIDAAANNDFGYCNGRGMEQILSASSFRLAG